MCDCLLSHSELKDNALNYNRGDVINALSQFVVRVASGEATSDKEIEILPEVAYALMYVVNKGKSC